MKTKITFTTAITLGFMLATEVQAACVSASEQSTANLACSSGQTVSAINFASYGTATGSCGSYATSSCNATTSKSVVSGACLGKSSCSVLASNSVFGDPCPGTVKSLKIDYSCAPSTTTVCGKSGQSTNLALACPSGQSISRIVFASYGTPTGSCGSYATSSCNASTSNSVVSSACLGKSNCSIYVHNGTFGNPCPGISKYLAVQVECKGSATPSPTPTPTATVSPKPSPTPSPTTTAVPTASGIGPTITSFRASGPITAVSGQVITGLHITNPSGPCIKISNASNVTIYNNKIGPCGLTSSGVGIYAINSSQITVKNNRIEDVASAFYAQDSTRGTMVFERNYTTKVRGPFPRGQMVQLNNVHGPGLRIQCNISDQAIGGYGTGTGPEDHVNLYRSTGTIDSPILVANNKIRGGGSPSGGGIMTGDYAGGNIIARDNVLVEPGQYGIAIAGGTNIKLLRNLVYGPQRAWTNVGAYVWNQYSFTCAGHEVRGNRVYWINKNGSRNPSWNAGNCGSVLGYSDNAWGDSTVTSSIWNTAFPECK